MVTRGLRKTWWFPVLGGALVGLLTGFVGMFAGSLVGVGIAGALLGAVCGGAVAAALADRGAVEDVVAAGLADVTSSGIFFCVVLVWYLGHGNLLSAAVAAPFALLFGAILAIPVALVSVVLAVAAGTLTTLTKRGLGKRVRRSPGGGL